MRRIRVSKDAERDLDQIWIHVATNASEETANRFIDRLTSPLPLLARNPRLGRSRDEIQPGLRSLPVDDYVVFYQVMLQGILILRILHGARDIDTVFD